MVTSRQGQIDLLNQIVLAQRPTPDEIKVVERCYRVSWDEKTREFVEATND